MTGILIVNKPSDWTSHDVVAKLRGVLHEKHIGHGGTLDPMATGVLPVFVGRATRAVEFCEVFDKEYIAGLRLGIVTDTQDTTGRVVSQSAVTVTRQDLEKALSHFTGTIQQLPPMYSAIKVKGTPLYKLARRGEEAERKPRPITIRSIEILGNDGDDYVLKVSCSKGTYIRTLCHDIGAFLGCGGTMYALHRTRVGIFSIEQALTLPDIEASAGLGRTPGLLLPVDAVFTDYPAVALDDMQFAKCLNGAAYPACSDNGFYRVYDKDKRFVMLGRAENGMMYTVKSFFEIGLSPASSERKHI
jgi:tRNA pseudouridine55 synthase